MLIMKMYVYLVLALCNYDTGQTSAAWHPHLLDFFVMHNDESKGQTVGVTFLTVYVRMH